MHVSELKVMRRKNLGNYEHEEVTVTITQAPGEDTQVAMEHIESIFGQYDMGKTVKMEVAKVKKVEKKIAEPAKETIEDVTIPPVIEVEKPKKKTTKKDAPKEEVSKDDEVELTAKLKNGLLALFRKWGSREPVDALVQSILGGELKMVKDMDYDEKVRVLAGVEAQ